MKNNTQPKGVLCYVDGPWAWFTTQELSKQWGDDWDDAPYEHNAEEPNPPSTLYFSDGRGAVPCPKDHDVCGKPLWEISKVAWEGPLETPADRAYGGNSLYSVEKINRGDIAWLAPGIMAKDGALPIPAGTTFEEFVKRIEAAGGIVYVPLNTQDNG